MLDDAESLDAATEGETEALQTETDAEDGKHVRRIQVPDISDDTDIGVVFRRAGAGADHDGVEGAEEGEQGVNMGEGVDVDDVDGGTRGEGDEGGEIVGEGVVGIDEEDAVGGGSGRGHGGEWVFCFFGGEGVQVRCECLLGG